MQYTLHRASEFGGLDWTSGMEHWNTGIASIATKSLVVHVWSCRKRLHAYSNCYLTPHMSIASPEPFAVSWLQLEVTYCLGSARSASQGEKVNVIVVKIYVFNMQPCKYFNCAAWPPPPSHPPSKFRALDLCAVYIVLVPWIFVPVCSYGVLLPCFILLCLYISYEEKVMIDIPLEKARRKWW